jgi:hypothetical protein
MAERLSNLGYGALKKETTPGVAVTPNVFFPLYKESMQVDLHLDMDDPIMGVYSKTYAMFMGMRSFGGALTVKGEPNTAEYWFDMLLNDSAITGAGPYTHPFTEGPSNSYTLDLAKGQMVHRYFGVMADAISPSFNKDRLEFEVSVAARGAFIVGKIATVTTNTITLDTAYGPNPTNGLVATDLVRLTQAASPTTILDTTITTINADGVTLVLGASAAAYAAGDFIFLRPQTVSTTLLTDFLFGKTQFGFGVSAAAALAAATAPIEEGVKWKIMYDFESKNGAARAGSFDPAALVRTQTSAELIIKKFFDTPEDLVKFNSVGGQYCVIRHFSGATNQYELRITLNNLIQKTAKQPLEFGKIIYNEIDFDAVYNTADGQAFDVKVLNGLAA